MTDVAKLRILVDMDSAGVLRGTSATTAALLGLERTATSSLGRVTTAFSGLSTTQKSMVGVGTAAVALGTAIGATIRPAIEFESAFAGVEKTVNGTPAQLSEIRDGLLDLSKVMPVSASQLAEIAENAGQLGVAAPDVLQFTEVVAQLGATTDLTFDGAAQSLARFLNITEGGVENVQGAADVLVELGNNSATTESQILTFATRLAASFTAAGAGQEQIQALAAGFSSLGVEAEAGGSALSRVITVISDAAKTGGAELEILATTAGVTTEEFAELALSSGGAVKAFILFEEGLGRVIDEGRSITPILEALNLQGIRTSRVLTLGALSTDQLTRSLLLAQTALVDGGAAQTEYDKRVATTAAQLEILGNRINTIAVNVGTPFLGFVVDGAVAAGDAIEKIIELAAPLGQELFHTFELLAEAGAAFYDAIGEPAVQSSLAALNGLIVVTTEAVRVVNSFGPAGLVVVGSLGAMVVAAGGLSAAMTAVQVNVAATALSFQLAGVRATAASVAMKAAQSAAVAGPYLAVAAALAAVGKAFYDADQAARSARESFEGSIAEGLESGDYAGVVENIGQVTRRIEELDEISGRNIETSFNFVGAIQGTVQALTPMEDKLLDAAREADALQAALAELGLGRLQEDVRLAAQYLGLSEEATFGLAQEMGVLGALTQGTTEDFFNAVYALEEYKTISDDVVVTSLEFENKVVENTAALEDYAGQLGLTVDQFRTLINLNDDIDVEDFVGGDTEYADRMGAFATATGVFAGEVSTLSELLGVSRGVVLDQIEALSALAESYDEVQKAVSGARSAQEAQTARQQELVVATNGYADAVEALDGSKETLDGLAAATNDLLLATVAAEGGAANATQTQIDMYAAFYETALAAGFAAEDIQAVGTEMLNLPPSAVVEVAARADKANADLREVRKTQDEVLRQVLIEVGLEGVATTFGDLDSIDAAAEALGVDPYFLSVNVDPEDALFTLDETEERANEVAGGEYEMQLTADKEDAEEKAAEAEERARLFADADYVAFLRANGVDADEIIEATEQNADDYAARRYNANLTATDQASRTIEDVRFAGLQMDGTYNATLKANDQASGTISNANRELGRFQSKTITIATVYRRSGIQRHGSISFQDGGITAFEDGGVAPLATTAAQDVVRAGVVATPGVADIFAPATPYRIFAEPATGGESYIPHYGDRNRNRNIWETTGRMLGFMANGGIASYQFGGLSGPPPAAPSGGGTSVNIDAPINVDLANLPQGADLQRLVAEFQTQINRAFADMGRTILNAQ